MGRDWHRALSGGLLAFDYADTSGAATANLVVNLDGTQREFTSGHVELGQAFLENFGMKSYSEEFDFAGGQLRMAGRRLVDATYKSSADVVVATWQASRYSVSTFAYHSSVNDVLTLFQQLDVHETEFGPTVSPKRGSRLTVARPAEVTKDIPGIGPIECVELSRETARHLPAWKGTRVHGGEVFKDEHVTGDAYYVFVTDTVVGVLLPSPDVTDAEALELLDGLSLEWTW
ncbi:MAG: hypothetical protein M3N32_00615 [Actinomycetota bacterium]|nr:hypothetical protein [Actinomycetota bacterium]